MPISPPPAAVPRSSAWPGRLALAYILFSLVALVVVPVLVQRRVDEAQARVERFGEPARFLVSQMQYSLSGGMSSLRGYLLTGDPQFRRAYVAALRDERRAQAELEPLAEQIGGKVLVRFAATRTLSDQWHQRVEDDALAARADGTARSAAQVRTEQELFEETLRTANQIDLEIARALQRNRDGIRAVERLGLMVTGVLGLLALGAAGVAGWLGQRVHRLADEAERRRAQAEQALAETARANEARARLLRGITHDVKNPLGAADGYAELLEMGIKGPLAPAQAPLVDGIRRSVRAALAIVADLLDLARADSGGLTLQPVGADLARIVGDAVSDHRAAAQAAGHTLHWERAGAPLEVQTDPARVVQVLGNLLSNAIKYTPAPGRITVRTEAVVGGDGAPRPGGWAVVRVADSGPGIPAEKRDAVFDEFTRLHDGTEVKGHGLGLAISRRIARLLGGDLSVDGEAGEGATFTLWLPLDGAAHGAGDAPTAIASTGEASGSAALR